MDLLTKEFCSYEWIARELDGAQPGSRASDLKALTLSISKWDSIVEALSGEPDNIYSLSLGPDTCALCHLYFPEWGLQDCDSRCPVIAIGGGQSRCEETPYDHVLYELWKMEQEQIPSGALGIDAEPVFPKNRIPSLLKAAIKERDFLQGILNTLSVRQADD